ncbi:hypothetical protein KIPB_013184 [Kipferlia bialata]|uniref:Uncharacterized protein n=1 Tax=Kipferlia bialata TaxID=797122 RepID=A0A9K3GPC2_9EUKA|nr:hypothetical protein KIPB_013184 [Kipferlia bialata]|eukprot:g13184.t1
MSHTWDYKVIARTASVFTMSMYSEGEILAAALEIKPSLSQTEVRRRFYLLGGSPRWVFAPQSAFKCRLQETYAAATRMPLDLVKRVLNNTAPPIASFGCEDESRVPTCLLVAYSTRPEDIPLSERDTYQPTPFTERRQVFVSQYVEKIIADLLCKPYKEYLQTVEGVTPKKAWYRVWVSKWYSSRV